MDASKFLKEYTRMCASIPCSKCALCTTYSCIDDIDEASTPEKIDFLVKAVEKWSKEHPAIKNREKFKEVFGDDWCKEFDVVIENSRPGVSNFLSDFLESEYTERKEK